MKLLEEYIRAIYDPKLATVFQIWQWKYKYLKEKKRLAVPH